MDDKIIVNKVNFGLAIKPKNKPLFSRFTAKTRNHHFKIIETGQPVKFTDCPETIFYLRIPSLAIIER